jgi:cation:H+ antiporter
MLIKMIIQIGLILIGFIMLIKGADILVDGSSAIAKKLRISEIVIGLTIVSIGTSMPELFVSTASALQGSSDISIGNVIGSNICNLLLI